MRTANRQAASVKILRVADQMPPSNEEAERAVLGSMILSKRAIIEVPDALVSTEFYLLANRIIYDTILLLHKSGHVVDLITVKGKLESAGKLQEIGGIEYLVNIVESTPSAANALFYAAIVREKAILRSLDMRGREITAMAYDLQRTDTAYDRAAEAVAKVATLAQLSGESGEPTLTMRQIKTDQTKGIPTGLPSIDRQTSCNGIPCGQPSIVMAATNVGKTPFLCQVALSNIQSGRRVFYALFADLTPSQLKGRFIKLMSGHQEPGSNLDQATDYADALRRLDDPFDVFENLLVYDADTRDRRTIEAFMSEFRRAHSVAQFDLVCLDYLQKINTRQEVSKGSSARTFDRVSMVADEIEGFSKEYPNTAFLLASQVTANDGKVKARYGAEVENDASLALWIDREKGATETAIVITKNRFGNSGLRIDGFQFDTQRLRFNDPMDGN